MRPQEPKATLCKTCPRFNEKRCSPSEVSGDIDVLFISDQPDIISAANNEPFYGHSGRIVKTAINILGEKKPEFEELNLRFSYAAQCIDIDESPISKPVLDKCSTFLEATIASRPPKLVVAMGATVVKQLGFRVKFSDVRGRVLESPRVPAPVFVTFAEKALLAQPGLFNTFKLDILNIFSRVMEGDGAVKVSLEELAKDYVIPGTVEEVEEVCAEILQACDRGHPADWAISVDTETTTLYSEKDTAKIIGFCFGWGTGRATTILYEHPNAPPEYLAQLSRVTEAVGKVLSSSKPKIFHNAKFDLKFLERRYNFKVNNVKWDTLLGEHLLDEDKKGNYGLKGLTAGWLPNYCGYEDKLHDLLNDGSDDTLDQVDKRIQDLTAVISYEHKEYLEALQSYRVRLKKYHDAKPMHDAIYIAYQGALQGYYFAKADYEARVAEWKTITTSWPKGKRGKPKKPTKWFSKPKKPQVVKRPKEPKDPRSKKERKVFTDAGFENLPIHDLCTYGAVDADVTRQLAQIQISRIKQEKSRVNLLMKSHAIPVCRALGGAEFRGTRIDQDYIEVLDDALTKVIEATEIELYQMTGTCQPSGADLNIASTQQIGNVLYNWGWTHPDGTHMDPYPVTDRTAKDAPSTADKTLKQFLTYEDEEKEIPCKEAYFIERYTKWKKAKKAKDTFLANIRVLSRRDGFLHTNFHINGTGTGRLSSSDMNLQNIPKYLAGWNIKKLFIVSDDDYVFVNADYRGAEVRVFTAYARDDGLIEAINNGLDMHSFFASKVFHRPYEHYRDREDDIQFPDENYRKELDRQRTQIKRVVFGILYGAGPFKISETIGVSIQDAKALIQLLFEMFPAIEEYGRQVEYEIATQGYVETLFSRRRRFPLGRLSRHRHKANRQGKNFKIQSTSSDIVLGQLVEIDEHLQNEFGGRMLLTVHDSIGFEFPKKYLNQLEDFLDYYGQKRVSAKYPWLPVPFDMDIEVGPNYGEVQPLRKYLEAHPFVPTPEGIVEEHELLTELREDAFLAS